MLKWCKDFEGRGPYDFFEVFSGKANTTKWWCLELVCIPVPIDGHFTIKIFHCTQNLGTSVGSNVHRSI